LGFPDERKGTYMGEHIVASFQNVMIFSLASLANISWDIARNAANTSTMTLMPLPTANTTSVHQYPKL